MVVHSFFYAMGIMRKAYDYYRFMVVICTAVRFDSWFR